MHAQKPLISRLGVAAWGIPLIILVTLLGGWVFALFFAFIAAIALYEFYSLAETRHLNPQTFPAVLLAFLAVFSTNYILAGYWLGLMLTLAVLLAFIEIRFGEQQGLRDLPVTLFGWVYIPLLLGTLVYLRAAVWDDSQTTAIYTLFLFSAIWVCDTAAYTGGKAMGKHHMAPFVSPKKTWEGAFFGLLGSVLWAILWWPVLAVKTDLNDLIFVAVIVGVIGQMGDLVESYFKRSSNVKDSGTMLAEHGGVLDRFDSLILTAPFIFIYQLGHSRIILF
jgi:phosphatidate cytidylyltransferase